MTRWASGGRTMEFLIDRGRLESFTADDLGSVAEALLRRATLRVSTSARAALDGGDVDGAFVLAYDGYRLAAESLLARQGLRATGGDGSHMTVEDAVSPSSVRTSLRSRRQRSSGSVGPVIPRSTSTSPLRRLRNRMRLGRSGRRRLRSKESERCWRVRRLAGSLPARQVQSEHRAAGHGVVEGTRS
jgi:hypothetical protein